MCIIAAKPRDVTIPKERLEACFENNDDGAGFAYLDEENKLRIIKGFFTFDKFYEEYQKHESGPLLLHFRIKTHGLKDSYNCHPFRVTENLVFAHNGIITGLPNSKDKSDTYIFNEMVVTPLVQKYGIEILSDEIILTLFEKFIGGSKVAFMNETGEFMIWNRNLGTEDNGVWYSNFSFRQTQRYWSGGSTKSYSSYENNASSNSTATVVTASTSSTYIPKNNPKVIAKWYQKVDGKVYRFKRIQYHLSALAQMQKIETLRETPSKEEIDKYEEMLTTKEKAAENKKKSDKCPVILLPNPKRTAPKPEEKPEELTVEQKNQKVIDKLSEQDEEHGLSFIIKGNGNIIEKNKPARVLFSARNINVGSIVRVTDIVDLNYVHIIVENNNEVKQIKEFPTSFLEGFHWKN